jgi:glycosyltransferase involved in cell wall biosynthesis
MRIMNISTRLILGGSQEHAVLSCEGQADDGHDVALVYGPIYGPEGTHLDRAVDHGGIECIETPNLVREISPWRDYRCWRQLRALINRWKPDVVHTHSSKAGIIGRAAAWKEGVPAVVHTIHGLPYHAFQSRRKNAIYIAAERFAAKRCHHIVCVADSMRTQSLANGIGRPDQFSTIYTGIEVDRYLTPVISREEIRSELGISEEDFLVGTIARLSPDKGHDDLLDGFGVQMQQDASLKMLWLGDGWWQERLVARIKEMGLEDQVVRPGLVPSEEVARYVPAMDLLAHPSYHEGLPRTIVQSFLAGIPVVATAVDGTPEVVLDQETGLLVEPACPDQLSDAIMWMRSHPAQRQEMGECGREVCRERFDARNMVEQLDELYRSLL